MPDYGLGCPALFVFGHGAMILWWPIRATPKERMSRGKIWRLIDPEV